MIRLCNAEQEWINPNVRALCAVLSELPADDNGYITLENTEDTSAWIQASGTWSDGFYLRYQGDEDENYYECVNEAVPAAELVGALVSFMEGGELWLSSFSWRYVEAEAEE